MTKKRKRSPKECIYCKVNKPKRKINGEFFMIAMDRPYKNVWIHRECYKKLGKQNVDSFLEENVDVWYPKIRHLTL